jgi:recombination protein RecA
MTTSARVCALLLLSLTATSAFVARPLAPTQSRSTPLFAAKKKAGDDKPAADSGRPVMDPSKRAALDGVLNQIERSYGRGSIQKLGEAGNMVVASISSGALTLDAALGGGFPKGRVVEIYGPESSGKTTLALHAIAESQKMGGTAAFVDAEHALDPSYGT